MNQLANYEVDKAYVSHYQESLFNQARHRGLTLPARPGSIRRLLGASLIRLGEQIRGRHQQCLAESQRETSLKLAS